MIRFFSFTRNFINIYQVTYIWYREIFIKINKFAIT